MLGNGQGIKTMARELFWYCIVLAVNIVYYAGYFQLRISVHAPLQVLPDSIRGVVLGLASRVVKSVGNKFGPESEDENFGALCVMFGSPSFGFPYAIGRLFSRVSVK